MFFYLFLWSFTSLAQESNPAEREIEEDVIIYVERTACYGTCPIFNFRIFEDGKAIFEGVEYVDKIGFYESKLSPKQIEQLTSMFKEADFFKFKDHYTSLITDMPTTYIYFSDDEDKKMIVDYHGSPERLKLLENEVISFLKNLEWKALKK